MIAIACDHWGVELKMHIIKYLQEKGYEVCDKGCDGSVSVDYPHYAAAVCREIQSGAAEKGILICGTGIGMSMMANRFTGIRAALCTSDFMAHMTRLHNNANVLCMGANLVGKGLAEAMVEEFISTEYEGGRHQRRLDMLDDKTITG